MVAVRIYCDNYNFDLNGKYFSNLFLFDFNLYDACLFVFACRREEELLTYYYYFIIPFSF